MSNLDPQGHPGKGAPSPDDGDSLYARRKSVFPRQIDGTFRRMKWAIMTLCLSVYYLTPWLRWHRGAYAPTQAVLIDLGHRRFYMFDIEIWPQEFYFVAGLLIMAGVGLFIITSAVGRAWCGYACPQTVWVDLFQHIDRLIDGDRNAQARLEAAPWSVGKLAKRTLKYGIFLGISLATGGAWILYFADAPSLWHDFWHGDAPPVAYATVAVLTGTTFWLGAIMREQVCVYMCPWPRIQSAMLDEKSLTVTYKVWRGEPRSSVKAAKAAAMPVGDCIDCGLCTAVCPTGIDIRQGPQIGCITCGLCIDACDRVMGQLDRPRGLIDYVNLEGAAREQAGEPALSPAKALWHPRTLVYLMVWGGIGLGLLFALGTRHHIALNVAKDRNPPYMLLSDGTIRNAYSLRVRNMEDRPRRFAIAFSGVPGARMWADDMARGEASGGLTRMVDADQTLALRVYVEAPANATGRPLVFTLAARDAEGGSATYTTRFGTPDATTTESP